MYELQSTPMNRNNWKYAGRRSGSISDLKDYADIANTDYRIVDESGKVVWDFFADFSRKSRRSDAYDQSPNR